MTGDKVLPAHVSPFGALLGADVDGDGTARVEAATWRWVDRTRDVALQNYALP
jgi:hypothetical protein